MTNSSEKTAVLIAGAGPTGLVLALTLAQNKVPVRILEKEVTPRIGQRGAGVQPRSLELLKFMGVLPDVEKLALDLPKMCMYKMPEGVEVVKTFHLTGEPWKPTPDMPYPNTVLLGQSSSEEILRDHLAKLGVEVEFGTELVSFEHDDKGVTATVVRHGPEEGKTETISSEWLVCADGGRSHARKTLGLTFLGETRDSFRAVITDVEAYNIDPKLWHIWGKLGSDGFILRPTEHPHIFNTMITAPPDDPLLDRAQEGLEGFVEAVRAFTNRKDIEFKKIVWQSDWMPNIRIVDEYRKGRVFVAGDAAHIHSPTGGQGANTGMQDGLNLGWKLSLVCKGLASESLLDSFNDERHPVAKEMLQRTTNTLDGLLSATKKEELTPIQMSTIFKQLSVNYRCSSIVVDQQAHRPEHTEAYLPDDDKELRAGDRAPDAPNLVPLLSNKLDDSAATSLFDLIHSNHHTLLLFDPKADQVKAVSDITASLPQGFLRVSVVLSPDSVPQAPSVGTSGATVLVDTQGHAYSAYHPASEGFTMFIIRPDGVIGAVLKDEEGLQRYFKTILV